MGWSSHWTACAAVCALACNSHPLSPLEATLSASNHERITLAERTKLDFLFVVDNSQSMCEEQANLARNFRAISEFLFARLGDNADFRVAAVSTDMAADGHAGRFTYATADTRSHCGEGVEPLGTALADCDALLAGQGAILRSGPDGNIGRHCDADPDPAKCLTTETERLFGCLVGLGTDGSSFEQGLEAMRTALSCDGPNSGAFDACCTEDGRFDPTCRPAVEPAFLRPDATLVVVIVSDEDDCSFDPADPVHSGDVKSCLWEPDKLLPVDAYVEFLRGLKRRPAEQLVVATIAAPRSYDADGAPHSYAQGDSPVAACESDAGRGFAGTRYLEFTEAFGRAGVGCPAGAEGTERCVHICEGSFSRALDITRDRIEETLGSYCLDRPPACADPTECPLAVHLDGTPLPEDAFTLDLEAGDCDGGARLTLHSLPDPGSEVTVDYLVATHR